MCCLKSILCALESPTIVFNYVSPKALTASKLHKRIETSKRYGCFSKTKPELARNKAETSPKQRLTFYPQLTNRGNGPLRRSTFPLPCCVSICENAKQSVRSQMLSIMTSSSSCAGSSGWPWRPNNSPANSSISQPIASSSMRPMGWVILSRTFCLTFSSNRRLVSSA